MLYGDGKTLCARHSSSTLCKLTHLTFPKSLGVGYDFKAYLMDGEMEAQKDWVTCLKSPRMDI